MPDLVIPSRYCGPPASGNGGYVCGRVAGYLSGPVTVTLRQPVPLAAPMTVAEAASLDQDTAILLGRMTADLVAQPAAGDPCRVVAWLAGRDGRKLTAGSALIGQHGEVLAVASTLWLTVPRPTPAPAAGDAA